MRKIAALIGAVVLSTAMLVGCGSDSSAESNSSGTSSGQEPGDNQKVARDSLPEGFPEDVPLPGFTEAKQIGGDGEWWSIVLMLKSETETPVEDYAAQLTDAGYTVDADSAAVKATGPKWEISFHSSMDKTLTVAVMSK